MNAFVHGRAVPRISMPALALAILLVAQPAVAQTVRGQVLDTQSGQPVTSADVYLVRAESDTTAVKQGLTNESGRFSLTAPRPGRYRLRVERIGYRTIVSSPFDLVASEPLEVELHISTQAIPLAPLTVVSSRPALLPNIRLVTSGFFDREAKWGPKGLGMGTFIDKDAIERRQPRRVSDMLRNVPGVLVEGAGPHHQAVYLRTVTTLGRAGCTPMLYIDGAPYRLMRWTVDSSGHDGLVRVAYIDDLVMPSSVAAIEVYPRITKPGEFTDMSFEPCGAIAIWTGFAETGAARGGGGGPAGGGSSSGEPLRVGERPRENGNTKTAQRLLAQADSTDDEAAAESLYRQALDAAQVAIAADSTNPLPHLQAGEAAIGVGDYEEADRQLVTADRLRPLYQLRTESLRKKAWVDLQQQAAPLVSAGQVEQAIPIYEDANAIYRERPEVMLVLGQLYAQEGKDDRALANLDSAAFIIQDSAKLASVDSVTAADWKVRLDATEATRAVLLAHVGRDEESIGAFRQLVRKYPDDIRYKWNLAQLLARTGRTADARQAYDEILQDPTLDAGELYQIGVDLYRMADYAGAVKGFSGAAGKRPNDRDALEMWTRSLAMDSAYAQMPGVAERWIALDPNNEMAYILEAQVLGQQGDRKKSQDLVNRVQDLKATVANLSIDRPPEGGATVTGTMTNKKLASGARVSITFTFYDEQGNAVGTQSETLTVGAQGQAQDFAVRFGSDAKVGGYGYTLTTS
ncbi:MAG: carboxypeptidase regulatory-like domain-containing protein [Gemmatimonadetes bacterium]|nr:carboxypeptidase regulatory-like domain-containing protein [Gemmatimonadota bacterium]